MVKFKCPRCLKVSNGRPYHAACFEEMYREEQILKAATEPQAKKEKEIRKRRAETKMLALVVADKRVAAMARGISPRSLHELDNAEVSWTELLNGRTFN